jgi:phage portal protein BeeE
MPSFLDRLLGRPEPARPMAMPLGVTMLDTTKAVVTGTAWSQAVGFLHETDDPPQRAAAFLRAYKVGWFYKAESKISLDIANLKRALAPEDEAGDNETALLEADLTTPWESLDPPHQFLRLMERPNPNQTGRQLFQKTQIRLDMAGWTYWYMEDAGPVGSGILPTAIYGISPSRMTPSFDKEGRLIGWVMDKDRRGGGVPFEAYEIVQFSQETAEDVPYGGQGVVEAVMSELTLGDQYARHQSDLLSTGGRLAGMLWPKERTLDEAEFKDAQNAWRSVSSDPNAARRLLLFPEPMEYATGAADPKDIGIPELAALNRDNILTAFPIAPEVLGVPMPAGLNASGESRRELKREYWEGTIHPRVELLEEVIQTKVVSLYEAVMGTTYDFDIMEPNLDDATSLLSKVAAFDALTTAGFKAEDVIETLGLDTMEWTPPPPPAVPNVTTNVGEPSVTMPVPNQQLEAGKATKSVLTTRDNVTEPAAQRASERLARFFTAQQRRVTDKMRQTLPSAKADRMKASPTWWDSEEEDAALRSVMREIYADVGIGGLQTVADTLGRVILKGATQAVIADLLEVGGERIKDINARTLQALTVELAEGTRRGYSIAQLIDGVPDEGFKGILQAGLDNGIPAWSDTRAETIARTETMLSYNRATVTGYGEFGVTHLLAYDGDGDAACAARNGREFTIEEADGIADHPNGTLVWSPVVDKSWHEPSNAPMVQNFTIDVGDAIKSLPAPVITVEPTPVVVEPTDLKPLMAAVKSLSADIKAMPAPIVNVPEVKAPDVYVSPPAVTDVRVVSMPDREHKLIRDWQGKPTGTTEKDA